MAKHVKKLPTTPKIPRAWRIRIEVKYTLPRLKMRRLRLKARYRYQASEHFLKPLTQRFDPCSFVELVAAEPQAVCLKNKKVAVSTGGESSPTREPI